MELVLHENEAGKTEHVVTLGPKATALYARHHFGIADKNFSMQYAHRIWERAGTVWVFNLVSYVDKNTKYGMIQLPQLFFAKPRLMSGFCVFVPPACIFMRHRTVAGLRLGAGSIDHGSACQRGEAKPNGGQ